MPQVAGGGDDGHMLDEVIYLLSGYQVCEFCGSQITGNTSYGQCVPVPGWRDQMDNDMWGVIGHKSAWAHDRYEAVKNRVKKERASAGVSGLWQNPSL